MKLNNIIIIFLMVASIVLSQEIDPAVLDEPSDLADERGRDFYRTARLCCSSWVKFFSTYRDSAQQVITLHIIFQSAQGLLP